METQVIEGTLAEVQQRLSALPLKPDTRLRVIVSEPEKLNAPEEALFADAQRRNGLILVPTKSPERPVTVELVKELMED